MMMLNERIDALSRWGEAILADAGLNEEIHQAYLHNKWFTDDNSRYMLNSIATHFLASSKLQTWLADYNVADGDAPELTVGLVLAGNVPIVGFHDLLCVLVAGHKAQIKLSSKDNILLPYLLDLLYDVDVRFREQIEMTERLHGFDAVIATGGNNTARYFEHYFGKYPHIIRRNRNSVAVLDGTETLTDLLRLGDDIFRYFGLGCRNVSKLLVPRGYDFTVLLSALEPFGTIMMHDKYKNNYDYQRTLLLLNNTPHYASDFLMLKEATSIASAIATLNYEFYRDLAEAESKLREQEHNIQCVVSKLPIDGAVPFGKSQDPELWDYADNVDTMAFLTSL